MEMTVKPSGMPHPKNRCNECKPSRAGWENEYEGCAECSQRDRIFDAMAKKGWDYWTVEHDGQRYWGLVKEDTMRLLTWNGIHWEYDIEYPLRASYDEGTIEFLELSRKWR